MKTIYLVDNDDKIYSELFILEDELYPEAKLVASKIKSVFELEDAELENITDTSIPVEIDRTMSGFSNIYEYLCSVSELHFQGELQEDYDNFDFVICC